MTDAVFFMRELCFVGFFCLFMGFDDRKKYGHIRIKYSKEIDIISLIQDSVLKWNS